MNESVFMVDVICVNEDGKTYQESETITGIVNVQRFINAFKPKRGYKAEVYHIERLKSLFDNEW